MSHLVSPQKFSLLQLKVTVQFRVSGGCANCDNRCDNRARMKNTVPDPGGFNEQELPALPGVAEKLNLPLCSFVPGGVSASSDNAGKKKAARL